jgi:hypothetical protein
VCVRICSFVPCTHANCQIKLAGEIYDGLGLSPGEHDGVSLLKVLACACKGIDTDRDQHRANECDGQEKQGSTQSLHPADEHDEQKEAGVHSSNSTHSSSSAQSQTQCHPLLRVLLRLRGPYAFVFLHKASNRIFFGKDPIGRRSLLVQVRPESFILSSTGPLSISDGTVSPSIVEEDISGTRDHASVSPVRPILASDSFRQPLDTSCCCSKQLQKLSTVCGQVPCSILHTSDVVPDGGDGSGFSASNTPVVASQPTELEGYVETVPGLFQLSFSCKGADPCCGSTKCLQELGHGLSRVATHRRVGSTMTHSNHSSMMDGSGMQLSFAKSLENMAALGWNITCLSDCDEYKQWQRVMCQHRYHIGEFLLPAPLLKLDVHKCCECLVA